MMPTRRQLGLMPIVAAVGLSPGAASAQSPRVLNIGVNRVSTGAEPAFDVGIHPVSYTHLTLPTNREV